MTPDEYAAYLRSPLWTARKAAVIRYRGYQCERCSVARGLQLHHRTYDRIGRELPEDLELLCEACHLREHSLTHPRFDEWRFEIRTELATLLEQIRNA